MSILEERRLNWPNLQNARDLGGLPTNEGGRIRPMALIRTDNHDRLTTAGVSMLRESGVTRIVDLRSGSEAERYPSPFRFEPEYVSQTLLDEADEHGQTLVYQVKTNLEIYKIMLERYSGLIGKAVTAIANAPVGGVVIHCHAGKDRTGLITALALSIAGVDPSVIAEDYAATDVYLADHYAAELKSAKDESTREYLRSFQNSRPKVMLETLLFLEEKFNGVEAYLLQAGVSKDSLEHLRQRLVLDQWDQQIASDLQAGHFDAIITEVQSEIKASKIKP
jgi:protein-tyrosine phosphatase